VFKNLKIEEIAPNPDQPRKFFDEEKHQELKGSIQENGLLQPVVVRPIEGGDTPYMLIAGERRWRACKAADLKVIPAKVVKGATEERAYVLSIAENVNRSDMTIMEEAGAYADLKAAGWTPAKIAKQFGKTETHITWRLGCRGSGSRVQVGTGSCVHLIDRQATLGASSRAARRFFSR
jgi:ParB family transcriptional regulator, chromosome partitioning protein